MFTDVHLKNFAAFSDFRWSGHGQINVVVGENDTGKSHLLKILYVIAKTVETQAARTAGDAEEPSEPDAFSHKLRWTFQPPAGVGALVKKGEQNLRVEAELAGQHHEYGLERSASKVFKNGENLGTLPKYIVSSNGFTQVSAIETNTVFLPPKEILTIFAAIEITRGKYEIYGFDDTYFSDMRDGMPENPIIDESVRLYEEGYNVDTQHPGK